MKYVWRIYRQSLLAVGLLVSLAIFASFFLIPGDAAPAIFGRVLVGAAMLYLFCQSKKKEFPYYRNLGVSKRKILIGLAAIDISLSLVIILTSYVLIP